MAEAFSMGNGYRFVDNNIDGMTFRMYAVDPFSGNTGYHLQIVNITKEKLECKLLEVQINKINNEGKSMISKFYKVPNYYNAIDNDYIEYIHCMEEALHDLEFNKLDIIKRLTIACNQNLLVYDSTSNGRFTSKLYDLLSEHMNHNFNDEIDRIILSRDENLPNVLNLHPVDMNIRKLAEGLYPTVTVTYGARTKTVLAIGKKNAVLLGTY